MEVRVDVKIHFSEYGHVAYPIKANEACTNMLVNICPNTHSRPLGLGQTVKYFAVIKVVMLHINLMGMKHRTSCKQIFCSFAHPRPLDGLKR